MISSIICLATMIYFESRDQPLIGQLSVGQVAMNRVMADQYPDDVCEVITQGRLGSKPAFRYAIDIASNILGGVWFDPTDGATHYHSIDVKPSWAKTMTRKVRIEDHIFYKQEKPDDPPDEQHKTITRSYIGT